MKFAKAIKDEISQAIAAQVERGVVVNLVHFTNAFISEKSEVVGRDVDFYKVCAFSYVQEVASSCIGKYSSRKSTKADPMLPGFERLQLAYQMVRGGDQVLVPVDLATDEELLERANEYRGQARGLSEHATEIEAYVRMRNAANDNEAQKVAA